MRSGEPLVERLDARSQTPAEMKLAALRDLFPEAFAEGALDIDALRRALGEPVDPGVERFGLTWPGRADAMRLVQQPSVGALAPDRDASVRFDETRNVIIEGDNLEVLKLLQKSYHGAIKAIVIDPPYNTGSDLIYHDDFRDSLRAYRQRTGATDAAGARLTTNREQSGRFHSAWLSMLYPRLALARNLLREDGVLFVCIDDHEVHTLRFLLDSVFGEENLLATFVWQARTSISNDQAVSLNHHYILTYARDRQQAGFKGERLAESEYTNPDRDPRGPWKPVPLDANKPGGNTHYPVVNPNTGREFFPPNGRSWAINPGEFQRLLDDGRIWFGAGGASAPKRKLFLAERRERGDTKTPSSLLLDAGTTQTGTIEVMELFSGQKVFDYPKPVSLIKRLLEFSLEPGDTVLDFFAGSGTTAHAAMALNAEDGGARRFILAQLPEPLQPPLDLGDGSPELRTIADICRERVRRAGRLIDAGDTGFRAYALTESNFTPWNGDSSEIPSVERQIALFADNILPERSPEDLLTEILLKSGYELTTPVEWLELAGNAVASVADGALLVCLDHSISLAAIEAMAARAPGQIVCLEAGFEGDDQRKVNALQIIRSRARSEDTTIAFKVV